MTEQDFLLRHLRDPSRVCPVFAGVAQIQGSRLRMRLDDEMIKISAPPRFLSALFDWCQGEHSLDELTRLSGKAFGESRFMDFVVDLLEAGVLTDAARCLPQLSLSLAQIGMRAADPIWKSLAQKKFDASTVPLGAISLSEKVSGAFSSILDGRESAISFGYEPVSEAALQQMLFAAYGVNSRGHRTVPSAGGFYRLTLHLILLRTIGRVAAGVYKIQAGEAGNTLLYPLHKDIDEVPRMLVDPAVMRNATGLVITSADFRPGSLKYRNRVYPYMLLEAGAVIQNMGLMAADLKIGWRTLGLQSDKRFTQFLHLGDSELQVVVGGVFGSLPQSDDNVQISASKPSDFDVEFGWVDTIKDLPFHMGMARIKGKSGESFSQYSWGRDINAQMAYDKSLAEATERYAYCQLGECIPARFGDFPHMLAPNNFVSYQAQQYDKIDFPFTRFDPNALYLWAKANCLSTGQQWWAPAECIYARSAIPMPYAERLLTSVTSSGCASGVTLQQAQASALFEVIERDAFMNHWFAQRGGENIDLRTLPGHFKKRIAVLLERGCEVRLQLLDLGVFPVWFFFVQHVDRHFAAVSAGAGMDAERSLESALSEVETSTYFRLQGGSVRLMRPGAVDTAEDHVDLYAQNRYFRRADALMQSSGEHTYDRVIGRFPKNMELTLAYLERQGLSPLWSDLSLRNAPKTLDGKVLISCRVLVPGLIPLAFSAERMPYGMDKYRLSAARFPHPFP